MVQAIKYIFHSEFMLRCWKDTFITLISKRQSLTIVSDYHPISLRNTVYKIMAKIFVNRMKAILPALIYKKQGAFVLGCGIVENILISQEVMHFVMHIPPIKCLIALKLDIEKAYNRIH